MSVFVFILNSILFGIGLAMDAFSVSMANGLAEPDMHITRSAKIAGIFGVFQMVMPLIGWFFVRTAARTFQAFQTAIPWIALFLLLYIGGKMLYEGFSKKSGAVISIAVDTKTLLIQAVATSIDALSVGFTIADFDLSQALVESLIIGVVTFLICLAGIKIGKVLGLKLEGKADILGGVILIAIGIRIFIAGIF